MPTKPEEAPAATDAKMLPHTPLRENISKDENPHLASEKKQAVLCHGTAGSQGEEQILSPGTAQELK